MANPLKFIYTIISFLSIFLVTKEVDGAFAGWIKCKVDDDCPNVFTYSYYKCVNELCEIFLREVPKKPYI